MQAATEAIHDETAKLVRVQQEVLEAEMANLDKYIIKAFCLAESHRQMQDGICIELASSARHALEQFQVLYRDMSTSITTISDEVEERSHGIRQCVAGLRDSVHEPLELLREHIASQEPEQYVSVGDTPRRIAYDVPTTLPRTQPHEQILANLRRARELSTAPQGEEQQQEAVASRASPLKRGPPPPSPTKSLMRKRQAVGGEPRTPSTPAPSGNSRAVTSYTPATVMPSARRARVARRFVVPDDEDEDNHGNSNNSGNNTGGPTTTNGGAAVGNGVGATPKGNGVGGGNGGSGSISISSIGSSIGSISSGSGNSSSLRERSANSVAALAAAVVNSDAAAAAAATDAGTVAATHALTTSIMPPPPSTPNSPRKRAFGSLLSGTGPGTNGTAGSMGTTGATGGLPPSKRQRSVEPAGGAIGAIGGKLPKLVGTPGAKFVAISGRENHP
jgi:hypothetical protein